MSAELAADFAKHFPGGPVIEAALRVPLDGFSVTVLFGPSGSGKTTVLRMIAGFEQPTGGAIELGGQAVGGLAPVDRDVNTVFQDYALFPHMNVRKNVEYGLKVKGVPRAERRRRAADALRSVRLEDFGRRRPSQLSGGQRQRVALARALVNRPRALLLDARISREIAPQVAALLAEELGRDPAWQAEQVRQFRTLADGYLPR